MTPYTSPTTTSPKSTDGRRIDYLTNDLFCCVAVGGYISGDTLYCFSIGDSHITTFDENFNELFTTKNNHKQFEDYLYNVYTKTHSYDWNNPQDRIMVRKEFRNNITMTYHGKPVSFGVLSGEQSADNYIDVYKVDLTNTKYICAYSDGCEPFFETEEEDLLQDPSILKHEGKERTLIIYERV